MATFEFESKPTLYNGTWYRSRLEAYYACAFEMRGVFDDSGMHYEKKKVKCGAPPFEYWPDFHNNEESCEFYAEVKGILIDDLNEFKKLIDMPNSGVIDSEGIKRSLFRHGKKGQKLFKPINWFLTNRFTRTAELNICCDAGHVLRILKMSDGIVFAFKESFTRKKWRNAVKEVWAQNKNL